MKYVLYLSLISLLVVTAYLFGSWQSLDSLESENEETFAQSKEQAFEGNVGLTNQELTTISLFEQAAPSVVFITTTTFRRDFWSLRATEIPQGTGSGFFWDTEGHIVTNYHVIQDARRIMVTLDDQSSYEAMFVGGAPGKDLAVLKIKNLPKQKIKPVPTGNSEKLKVGQSTFAIGNPFGLDHTLTTGVVSALGREISSVTGLPIKDVIQTDAAINPGNSGGPLLNSSGELIGVNTAIYSPSGAYAGIGFSIPVDVLNWVVPELIQFGEIRRPELGLKMATDRIQRILGIQKGLLVLQVLPGSPAEKSRIQATRQNRKGEVILGDILIRIDENEINSIADYQLAIENFKSGDTTILTVLNNRKIREVKLQVIQPR